MILDAITSSPINVIFSIVLGFGLVYIFYRRPPASSSSSSSSTATTSPNTSPYTPSGGLAGIGRHTSRQHSNYTSPFANSANEIIDQDLERVIAQIERQERDTIRQEQDEAYNQSLKADREKQLKREEEKRKKEEEIRLEKEESDRQARFINALTKLKNDINSKLPPEPSKDDIAKEKSVKLVFKLPDGSRAQRIFNKTDKVKYLYWYVFSLHEAPMQFKMTTNFPKRDLPGRPPIPTDFHPIDEELDDSQTDKLYGLFKSNYEFNCEESLEESGLGETQIIFVYNLDT